MLEAIQMEQAGIALLGIALAAAVAWLSVAKRLRGDK